MTNTVKDPVCGMEFDLEDAAAVEEHDGSTFHFCSWLCHDRFLAQPDRFAHPADNDD